jgi:nitroreductase
VRRRLDLSRPVARELIVECLALAQQAPTGGNHQRWSFVVATEPGIRETLGRIYAEAWAAYRRVPASSRRPPARDPERAAARRRIGRSAAYLAEHMGEAPVLLVPCISPRPEGESPMMLASHYGSIMPAVWSFMLAARARGLGTTLTTIHLFREREAAEALGIPYDRVAQVGMVPVAHTIGADFRPGRRDPLEGIVHWEGW